MKLDSTDRIGLLFILLAFIIVDVETFYLSFSKFNSFSYPQDMLCISLALDFAFTILYMDR